MGRAALVIACAIVGAGCGRDRADAAPAPSERAFYYWRTTLRLSDAERRALRDHRVAKLYTRLFDVEWSADRGGPEPVAKLAVEAPGDALAGIDVVPVVFIRQDVFRKLAKPAISGLARDLWAAVGERASALAKPVRELQIDCDWTERSRDMFFAFLRELRATAGNVRLSATIRLHQVKYRERTGVPPVDRGMLMFYNMGEFSASPGQRAIFDAEAAARYTARLADYPLPLDLALPIWSWTLHVRDDVVIDLMQATDPDELPQLDFVVPIDSDRFRATRTAFLHGAVIREGDVLKVERMTPAETLAAGQLVRAHLVPHTVSLFDLSERNLARYVDHLDPIFDLRAP